MTFLPKGYKKPYLPSWPPEPWYYQKLHRAFINGESVDYDPHFDYDPPEPRNYED